MQRRNERSLDRGGLGRTCPTRPSGRLHAGNHGKAAPLRRVKPGDRIIYYSPTTILGERDGLQAFTAIGTMRDGEPYQGDMGSGFTPFRRDVEWASAQEAPIKPLLDRLEFTAGRPNWGYQLRFGLFEISDHDFGLIAEAMGAAVGLKGDVA